MSRALLEVVATQAADGAGAVAGGADRLAIMTDPESGGRTPDVQLLRDLKRVTQLPIRVMLRMDDGLSTTGSQLNRMRVAAYEMASAGADGFVLGFLGPTLEVDIEATMALADAFEGLPWTFHRAIDHVLDYDRAWRRIKGLPGLDCVQTAGSPRGMSAGFDELCRRAAEDPDVAALVMAGGDLSPEQVPWLVRAGVRAFQLSEEARPGRSAKAYVDSGHVRSWRRLLDDAVVQAS